MARACATLVLALSTVVAVFPAPGAGAPARSDLAAGRGTGIDLALSVTVSRKRVPVGGALREVMRVTNRGTVTVPNGEPLVFGQEINYPGMPNYPGKAVYAFARSPGGKCSHGEFGGGSKIQTFACDVTRLAPGETQTTQIKIKNIRGPLLLDAHGFYGHNGRVYDDNRANDAAPTIIRVRRG
jgi:hypothetical protein